MSEYPTWVARGGAFDEWTGNFSAPDAGAAAERGAQILVERGELGLGPCVVEVTTRPRAGWLGVEVQVSEEDGALVMNARGMAGA